MDIPHILDNGKDIAFYCARLEGKTTLTACEELCPRHSSCDTAGMANDELASYERSEKTGYGLEELIRKANCKESEMERIVEALDEIDSGREY